MAWIDLLFLTVLLISVLIGVMRGLVFEVMALAGWLLAYLAAPFVSPHLESLLPQEKLGPGLSHPVALVMAFVLVLVAWSLLSRLMRALIHASPLSVLDRVGGAGFGVLRAVLMGMLVVVLVGMTPAAQAQAWQTSALAPWLQVLVQLCRPLLPASIREFIPA